MRLTFKISCAIVFLLLMALKISADQNGQGLNSWDNSIHSSYNPTYHGRDPFKPLEWVENKPQITITELEYHGIVELEGNIMALFGWRSNQTVRYTLKGRKLYSDEDVEVDGVVGDITKTEVVLTQGGQTIVYPK
jgi:hypothetical protein